MTIPAQQLRWRLRVRTPKDDGDLFVVTSLRLNDDANRVYNYLRDAPKFDGLQIDPLTGQVTVGACTLTIIDQFASILMATDGTAVPAPPPAPGNLIVANAILAGSWVLHQAAADVTSTYPPPTGKSFDGWPAAPSGQAELWNVYAGSIGGSGYFYRRGTFGPGDGLAASTAYKVRALLASFNDFQPRGVAVTTPYGDGNFRTTDSAGPPPLPKGWWDIDALTDGAGAMTIDVGWYTTIPSDANVIYLGALMIFDATGTPAGGGSPAGTGGAFGSGRGRLVTSYLADLSSRWRLLGLKAYLEESADGGSSWASAFASYVGHLRHVT